VLNVRRFQTDGHFIADMIWDETAGAPGGQPVIVDPLDPTRRKRIAAGTPFADLLVPVLRGGKPVYQPPSASEARETASAQLARFHAGIKRFVNPHVYPVGLERGLHDLKTRLILEARGVAA
jgi:nicotinate phosphoribosyltransferase